MLSPADPHSYADTERAKVAKFADFKQNMVKLLIDLSNDPTDKESLSQFAQKFLKKRESERIVVPSRLDYLQSDCFQLERDKGVKDFYPSFNSTSFENPQLSQSFVAKKRPHPKTNAVPPYELDLELRVANRFNEDLIAATRTNEEGPQPFQFKVGTSASQQPTQLLGATLREPNHLHRVDKAPVPIFGLSSLPEMQGITLNDPSPFGISLAIPSLPPYEPDNEATIPKTFFSIEPQ